MRRPRRSFAAHAALPLLWATLAAACGEERPVLRLRDAGVDAVADAVADAVFEEGIVLTVDPQDRLGRISPLIYGFHMPDSADPDAIDYQQLRPTLIRIPGFRPSTYNWEINASNGGQSWCHQNDPAGATREGPAGAIQAAAEVARSVGATLVVAVPIGDRVAGDVRGGSGPPACTGDVRRSADYLTTRFVKNVAVGPDLDGDPDGRDDSVYATQMVAWLKQNITDVPIVFSLDRLPDAWSVFHPALWASPATYDDVCARGARFATAIKTTWPEAPVTGPVVSGWSGLMALGDRSTERGTKGDFYSYYLSCMRRGSTRLLDALDFYWGSGATAGGESVGSTGTSEAVVAARVQAARSLWDPRYRENSIAGQSEGPLRLLPRLREAIDAIDPQVEIFVSEWSFGGTDHPSGAVAVADALGVFGRLGVKMAALRWQQERQRYSTAALRMFRNFDGRGGHFGDEAIAATSSEEEAVAIHGSVHGSGEVTLVLINKMQEARQVRLSAAAVPPATAWARFVLAAPRPEPVREADVTMAGASGAWALELAPLSVTILTAQP